jgi:hypothetical protein
LAVLYANPLKEDLMPRKITIAAAVIAAAAIAAPGVGAKPIDPATTPALNVASEVSVPAGLNGGLGPSGGSAVPAAVATSPAGDESAGDGFDWGDAGIGAAGALSLLGLGAGAVILARRGRGARPAMN